MTSLSSVPSLNVSLALNRPPYVPILPHTSVRVGDFFLAHPPGPPPAIISLQSHAHLRPASGSLHLLCRATPRNYALKTSMIALLPRHSIQAYLNIFDVVILSNAVQKLSSSEHNICMNHTNTPGQLIFFAHTAYI